MPGFGIPGVQTFHLSALQLTTLSEFELPGNLRLGHLVEKAVAELIRASANYHVMRENVQIRDGKTTLGELDFLLQHCDSGQVIHLELAYKFYLYDPTLSPDPIHNWIGPNRNDALHQKLTKLREHQFPLLHQTVTQAQLPEVDTNSIQQALCFMASLFVPFASSLEFSPEITNAIKGYYLDLEAFAAQDHSSNRYYMPSKLEWGLLPSKHTAWLTYEEIIPNVAEQIRQRQSPMLWCNSRDSFSELFVVWW